MAEAEAALKQTEADWNQALAIFTNIIHIDPVLDLITRVSAGCIFKMAELRKCRTSGRGSEASGRGRKSL
jgi:hypothetical protein